MLLLFAQHSGKLFVIGFCCGSDMCSLVKIIGGCVMQVWGG
jgi:hypothetical protein